ncbi:histidine phosphotransferase family protein [Profundibacterium mesophilum]|uniref:Histidine phosphotransferase ChpT n=1 Tax=Profundibacterium mesophilum KAUST100406-0324 TaxID=1037889 RepID=A0A921NTE5_9RHOB|nr:histidine phosphotransferase family protein [Profundibacterium mesophilum]KAF0675183.1 histidine phosphotransferase ChpT [Profundibacterium mesophilum KAUST100406-0324]
MSQDLTALLGSRICHDLTSPLGAIGNGVELLSMTGLEGTPELAMISESVESANGRIRYFRIAYGAASPGQQLGCNEIKSILDAVGRPRKLAITLHAEDDIARDEARLIFLILQCCETALPWGGTVDVAPRGGGWRIVAAGARMREIDALWEQLKVSPPPAEVAAAEVHFPLAREAARALGRPITLHRRQLRLEFSI